ncbi:hypothetical protein ACJJI5_10515 [Microbulbifer sp. EKSA008]|uniref:hypothetical protein n=1 Tax=unclassified Microbulbifer TaxID=2619833 RepID=UPI00403A768A
MLHPDFPIVEGHYQMTREWSLMLPDQFNRRVEDDDLIIWRPGFTIYVAVWGNDHNVSAQDLFEELKADISPSSYDLTSESNNDVLYFSYRLAEESNDERVAAFYCYAVNDNGYVQMAVYFDTEKDAESAKEIWRSLRAKAP